MTRVDGRGLRVAGYIYLAECADIPSCVKIGYTTMVPSLRVAQLEKEYGTRSPFTLYRSWKCKSPAMIEKVTHLEFEKNHFYREVYFLDEYGIDGVAESIDHTLALFEAGL